MEKVVKIVQLRQGCIKIVNFEQIGSTKNTHNIVTYKELLLLLLLI